MNRILITGAKGMLGRALMEQRPSQYDVLGVDVEEVDVTSVRDVRRCLAGFRPDAVIHCAAMTDVDGCETDPDSARRINVEGTRNVVEACGDARLIHVSTDFVFDGRRTTPYAEDDLPAPIGVYGSTKLAAEDCVREAAPDHAIVRTAWTFAPWGRNFVLSILRAAREQGRLRVVADQVGSPTYAPDLAAALWRLVAADRGGTFHLVNSGVVSRYDFAREVVIAAGMGDVPVEPITSAELNQPAMRPPYSALANTKLPALRHYREALADCVARLGGPDLEAH
ncbi:MAG: dTDP-4-dehydrorhamnose reductase [Armatimonadetes bacterium]|nr:dTDP-4-dehydrorhamnose reductase [Armatimonadota bacterium]